MLTQVSFALLYFYGWHAPKGGQLLFRFLLLSGFLPYPFATYHFFLPLFLSLLFSRFTRLSFFPRRSRCHGNCLIFHTFRAALFSLLFVLNFSRPPYSPLSFLIFPVPFCFPRFRISADFFLKTPEPCFPFATSPASSCSLLPFFFSTPLSLFCCSPLYETLLFSSQVIFHRLFA